MNVEDVRHQKQKLYQLNCYYISQTARIYR